MSAPDTPADGSHHLDRGRANLHLHSTARGSEAGLARRARLYLTEFAVVAAFCCSSMLLTHVGYHYDQPGGLPFEKFHPATLLLLAAFACLFAEGGPSQVAKQIVRQHPLTMLYVACVAYYVLYVSFIIGRPVSFVVDTLIAAAVAFILMFRMEPPQLNRIARAIHVVMAINAALGILESVFRFHLIPIYAAGELIDYDEIRSTALLGHPLQNASITAIYALVLLMGPRGNLRWTLAFPLFCLQLLSLPAFGGRTATVLLAVLMVLWIGKEILLVLLGKRFPVTALLWICLGLPVAALVGLELWESTYVTAFVDRFIDDSGSAETRVRMLRLFDGFSWGDLLIGPDPAMLAYLQFRVGTELGIESFPIAYILISGIFAASLIFIGLTVFVVDIARVVCLRSLIAVLMFVLLNASSTGLSSKGMSFMLVIAMVMSMEGSERGSRLSRKQHEATRGSDKTVPSPA